MSAKAGLCGMCQKSLGNDNRPEVTTSCKHTFHRECAIQRVTKRKALDCPKCHTPSALEYALFKDKLTSDDKQYSAQSKEVKNVCLLILISYQNYDNKRRDHFLFLFVLGYKIQPRRLRR